MTHKDGHNVSRRALLAATLPAMAVTVARAQNGPRATPDYPNHQVTFIVPFAPAGGTDVLARLLAEKLEQELGKPFVVENRPGAGTVIATNFVAKSPPDGYTIMMASPRSRSTSRSTNRCLTIRPRIWRWLR